MLPFAAGTLGRQTHVSMRYTSALHAGVPKQGSGTATCGRPGTSSKDLQPSLECALQNLKASACAWKLASIKPRLRNLPMGCCKALFCRGLGHHALLRMNLCSQNANCCQHQPACFMICVQCESDGSQPLGIAVHHARRTVRSVVIMDRHCPRVDSHSVYKQFTNCSVNPTAAQSSHTLPHSMTSVCRRHSNERAGATARRERRPLGASHRVHARP